METSSWHNSRSSVGLSSKPRVIDGFLQTYPALRAYADTAQYADYRNPADGVVYPFICTDIPDETRTEVQQRLDAELKRPVQAHTLFLRLSPAGVRVPHAVHTDNSMGRGSLMLYLTDKEGGTGFAEHRALRLRSAPTDDGDLIRTTKDAHDMGNWRLWARCGARENRACIFPAELFHVALPVGGYGWGKQDARLVLTAFFD